MTDPADPDNIDGPKGMAAEVRAFLIADVRGYTLFTQERGDEAAAKLAEKFALVAREGVQARGGEVIELRGDEALCVFPSPRQAIRAAVELQERFVDQTLADPALPLAVGIGLDAGEAVPVQGGYRGGALNLAARLCGQAGPGQIVASREIVHLARRVEGIKYLHRGEVSLKGLADPVTVIDVSSESAPAAARLAPLIPQRERSLASVRRRGRSGSSSRRRIAIGAVAVVAAVILVIALLQVVGEEPARASFPPGISIVDQVTGEPLASIPTSVIRQPAEVIYADGSFWVHNLDPTRSSRSTRKTGAS